MHPAFNPRRALHETNCIRKYLLILLEKGELMQRAVEKFE